MPFVSEDHPDARFCVTAYRSNDDEHGVTSYYTTLNEARSEFDSVSRGGRYLSVHLGRWQNDHDGWEDLDEWPEDHT
jgi:hypothetical protein